MNFRFHSKGGTEMMVKNALRLAAVVGMLMLTADVQAGARHARRGHASSSCGAPVAASCCTVETHVAAPCCTVDVSAPPAAMAGTDANAPPVAALPGERRSFSVEPSAGLPMVTQQPPMTSVPNYSAPSYSSRSRGVTRSSPPSYLMQKSDFHRYSTR